MVLEKVRILIQSRSMCLCDFVGIDGFHFYFDELNVFQPKMSQCVIEVIDFNNGIHCDGIIR